MKPDQNSLLELLVSLNGQIDCCPLKGPISFYLNTVNHDFRTHTGVLKMLNNVIFIIFAGLIY